MSANRTESTVKWPGENPQSPTSKSIPSIREKHRSSSPNKRQFGKLVDEEKCAQLKRKLARAKKMFTQTLPLVLVSQRRKVLLQKIEEIREGTEAHPSASKALVEDREQEDVGIGQAHCRVHSLPYHSRRKRRYATSSQIA
jgi:hypothetical protein